MKNKVLLFCFLTIGLSISAQSITEDYKLEFSSRNIVLLISLQPLNDTLILLKQEISNFNDSLNLFFLPSTIIRHPEYSFFASENDLFIYSSTSSLNLNYFESTIELFCLKKSESLSFCDTVSCNRISEISGILFWFDYAFENHDLNRNIKFIRATSLFCGGNLKSIGVYSISDEVFGENCQSISLRQRNVRIFPTK